MGKRTYAGATWWADVALVRDSPGVWFDGLDVGPRLRVLRLRAGLSLRELSRSVGLSCALLTRIESAALQQIAPKTIHKILDTIGVSEIEHRAVFFRERPPASSELVAEGVERFAARVEHATWPMGMLDERLNWLYLNRSARLLFGLSGEEYVRLLGSPMLLDAADPTSPLYGRYPDALRKQLFALKATSFRLTFGEQQLCRWYLQLEDRLQTIQWAWDIWNKPQVVQTLALVNSHDVTLLHPQMGQLQVRDQLNHLFVSPFSIIEWVPIDDLSAAKLAALVSRPYWLPPLESGSTTAGDAEAEESSVAPTVAPRPEQQGREGLPDAERSQKTRNKPSTDGSELRGFSGGGIEEEILPRLRREKKELVH